MLSPSKPERRKKGLSFTTDPNDGNGEVSRTNVRARMKAGTQHFNVVPIILFQTELPRDLQYGLFFQTSKAESHKDCGSNAVHIKH